jgi:predicted porin
VKLSVLLSAIAIGGLATSANGADLGGPTYGPYSAASTPAPLIANFFDGAAPGSMTVAGITVYGTVDFSAAYNSHGSTPTGTLYQGSLYQISKISGGPQFNATNNALSQSFVGVKTNEKLSDILGVDSLTGWSFISDAQIGFNPAWGDIADVCKTLRLNNGLEKTPLDQTANLDGSRCGQIFNGTLYGGIKNNDLGQLTYGRHNSLLNDALGAYDPEAGSYAFSLFAFSGTVGGGGGATEDARWNNSIRYANTIGMFRVAGMYRFEGMGQGGDAYSGNVGVDLPGEFKGLSIDGVYAHFNSAIAASNLSSGDCGKLTTSIATCQQLDILSATVSDNDVWSIMAKYNLGHFGLDSVTAMGGYEHINFSNPNNQLDSLSIIGGYQLFAGDVNYNKYLTDKEFDLFWFGGKWAITPKLTAAAAWYHYNQNTFLTGAVDGTASNCNNKSGQAASGNCAGSFDWVGTSLDYQWTKRLDVYAGVSYSQADDGLASGFTYTNTWNPAVGARFRF